MIEAYFGLDKAPFRLSTDEEFYFDSSMHSRALAYLKYGLQQGEGIVVLTGAAGVGKTTLIEHFLTELDADIDACRLLGTAYEPGDILPQVMAVFGAEARGETFAARMKALEAYFVGQINAGKQVVLVVDEAQNLPSHSLEELRLLTTLAHEGRSLLQVYLIGQPVLRERLAQKEMEHLRQRVVVSWTLKSLDEAETADYIDHRLLMAGWQEEDSLFTDAAVSRIYAYTQGIPRLINKLCARLLIAAALSEEEYVEEPLVEQVIQELTDEEIIDQYPDELLTEEAETVSAGDTTIMHDDKEEAVTENETPVIVSFTMPEQEKQTLFEEDNAFFDSMKKAVGQDRLFEDEDLTDLLTEDDEDLNVTSVMDRINEAKLETPKNKPVADEIFHEENDTDEISIDDVAREIRAAQKSAGEAAQRVDFQLPADDQQDNLQDREEQSDYDLDFDPDEITQHSDDKIRAELDDFIEDLNEALIGIAGTLEVMNAHMNTLEDRRARRNLLIANRLDEIEDVLNQSTKA